MTNAYAQEAVRVVATDERLAATTESLWNKGYYTCNSAGLGSAYPITDADSNRLIIGLLPESHAIRPLALTIHEAVRSRGVLMVTNLARHLGDETKAPGLFGVAQVLANPHRNSEVLVEWTEDADELVQAALQGLPRVGSPWRNPMPGNLKVVV